MNVNESELMNFFKSLYSIEEDINEQKEDIKDQLKGYAENAEVSPKALRAAYSYFKKIAAGKTKQSDLDEEGMLTSIIDKYMIVE